MANSNETTYRLQIKIGNEVYRRDFKSREELEDAVRKLKDAAPEAMQKAKRTLEIDGVKHEEAN
jgi:hypothetical protein